MAEDPEATELDLVDRARRGDLRAFDRLVQAHLPRVWRVAYRIVRNREDAEDVAQEVFLAAHRSLAEFRGDSALSTWLHRIAVTRALNHLERAEERVRRASDPLDPPPGSGPGERLRLNPDLADSRPSPLRTLEARERLRRLADCFRRLPAAWRAVVALRDGEGKAYEEIAAILGIALGTVRSRLARARLSLRDCVEGETP